MALPISRAVATRYPKWPEVFEVFICSEAGKPIYCFNKERDDEFVVTLMGVCQVLINFYIDSEKDLLKCITTASGLTISFAVKTPLIVVVVTHKLSPIDPQLVISQVFAQIVSILTLKTLRSVFEQRPTFDLRRLLGSSEKLIDTLIEDGLLGNAITSKRRLIINSRENDSKHSVVYAFLSSQSSQHSAYVQSKSSSASGSSSQQLSKSRAYGGRVLIPVMPLNPSIRDSVTNTIMSSVSATPSDVLFAVLFQVKVRAFTSLAGFEGDASLLRLESSTEEKDFNNVQLVTVINYNAKKMKLNPLDIQLLQTLIISSEGQLSSAESLWLPICLPRVDGSAFIHCHISYLNQSTNPTTPGALPNNQKMCLMLLTTEREDFNKCQHIKDTLSERLNKVHLTPVTFAEVGVPQVQSFAYHSVKPFCLLYRSWPQLEITGFSDLVSYIGNRMLKSNLKMLWMQSDRHRVALLGWRTSSHFFFGQFDVTVTHAEVIAAASNIVKWVRQEEGKVKIKDYQ